MITNAVGGAVRLCCTVSSRTDTVLDSVRSQRMVQLWLGDIGGSASGTAVKEESLRVPLETMRAAMRQRHNTSPRVFTRSRLVDDARQGRRENGRTGETSGPAYTAHRKCLLNTRSVSDE